MEKITFVDRPDNQRIQLLNNISEKDSEITELFLDFQWVYRNMQKVYDDVLDKHGLSESRFIILMFLRQAPHNELLPSVISEKLGATRATVSKLLKAMTLKGWVVKQASDNDKRSVSVKLTENGVKVLQEFLPPNFHTIHLLLGELTHEEIEQFSHLLAKIKTGTQKCTQEMEQ